MKYLKKYKKLRDKVKCISYIVDFINSNVNSLNVDNAKTLIELIIYINKK